MKVELRDIVELKIRGWTQNQLAEKLKCSQSTVSRTMHKFGFDKHLGSRFYPSMSDELVKKKVQKFMKNF